MKMHTVIALAGLAGAVIACSTASGNGSMSSSSAAPTTSNAAPTGEWRPLIDKQLTAWRGYKEEKVPKGWHVEDGVLNKTGSANDLVTKDVFGDFELEWEWKLPPAGNAGVFYRGDESAEKIYWTAPEYQLLDDAGHEDGKSRLTAAGSDYALYPSPAGHVKPANEWNSSRIVARGPHVEHWLNGAKVVEYEQGSPDWEAKMKASKFATWPKYGRLTSGHIGIQGDHEGDLSIRAMRIRTLP
jgi:hypothetical protein